MHAWNFLDGSLVNCLIFCVTIRLLRYSFLGGCHFGDNGRDKWCWWCGMEGWSVGYKSKVEKSVLRELVPGRWKIYDFQSQSSWVCFGMINQPPNYITAARASFCHPHTIQVQGASKISKRRKHKYIGINGKWLRATPTFFLLMEMDNCNEWMDWVLISFLFAHLFIWEKEKNCLIIYLFLRKWDLAQTVQIKDKSKSPCDLS